MTLEKQIEIKSVEFTKLLHEKSRVEKELREKRIELSTLIRQRDALQHAAKVPNAAALRDALDSLPPEELDEYFAGAGTG